MSNTCLDDSLHLLQGLIFFNIAALLLVNLEVLAVWRVVYTVINTSFAGFVVLTLAFPSLTLVHNAVLAMCSGAAVLVILLVSRVFAAYAALLSVGAVLVLAGTSLIFLQNFVVGMVTQSFAGSLNDEQKLAVAAALISIIVCCVAALYYFATVSRVFLRAFMYALLAELCGKTMYYNGLFPHQYCCDTANVESCSLYIGYTDWMLALLLMWSRLAAYFSFQFYRRDKTEKEVLQKVLKDVTAGSSRVLQFKQ
jgi:hypothetical protein